MSCASVTINLSLEAGETLNGWDTGFTVFICFISLRSVVDSMLNEMI